MGLQDMANTRDPLAGPRQPPTGGLPGTVAIIGVLTCAGCWSLSGRLAMKWILIVWLFTAGSMTTAEFETEEACKEAGKSIRDGSAWRSGGLSIANPADDTRLRDAAASIRYQCLPKGRAPVPEELPQESE